MRPPALWEPTSPLPAVSLPPSRCHRAPVAGRAAHPRDPQTPHPRQGLKGERSSARCVVGCLGEPPQPRLPGRVPFSSPRWGIAVSPAARGSGCAVVGSVPCGGLRAAGDGASGPRGLGFPPILAALLVMGAPLLPLPAAAAAAAPRPLLALPTGWCSCPRAPAASRRPMEPPGPGRCPHAPGVPRKGQGRGVWGRLSWARPAVRGMWGGSVFPMLATSQKSPSVCVVQTVLE